MATIAKQAKKVKRKASMKQTAGTKSGAKGAVAGKTVGKKTARKPAKQATSGTKAVASSKKAKKKAATAVKTAPKNQAGTHPAGPRASRSSPRLGHSVVPGIASYRPSKGEDYMNEPQREHFREILLAWRDQLASDITRTITSMQDESINHPDPTDRATQETDMSLELRSRDRERKLIKKIDETLQRIDEDDYGYCDNCGVEIGIPRLEVRPTATLCIDCKTLDEIRERQMV